jgi:hypothetical protein
LAIRLPLRFIEKKNNHDQVENSARSFFLADSLKNYY